MLIVHGPLSNLIVWWSLIELVFIHGFTYTAVQIALPDSDYVYDENEPVIHICANLTGDIERDLQIAVTLEEETAICKYVWDSTSIL